MILLAGAGSMVPSHPSLSVAFFDAAFSKRVSVQKTPLPLPLEETAIRQTEVREKYFGSGDKAVENEKLALGSAGCLSIEGS